MLHRRPLLQVRPAPAQVLLNVGENLVGPLREVGRLVRAEVHLGLVHLREQRVQVVDGLEGEVFLLLVIVIVLRIAVSTRKHHVM